MTLRIAGACCGIEAVERRFYAVSGAVQICDEHRILFASPDDPSETPQNRHPRRAARGGIKRAATRLFAKQKGDFKNLGS